MTGASLNSSGGLSACYCSGAQSCSDTLRGHGPELLSEGFSISWSQGGHPEGARRSRDGAASVSPGPSAWLSLWRRSCSPQGSHKPCLPPFAAQHHSPQTDSPPGSPQWPLDSVLLHQTQALWGRWSLLLHSGCLTWRCAGGCQDKHPQGL